MSRSEQQTTATLILGSGSPYRRKILQDAGIRCEPLAPDIEESQVPGEDPVHLARRLAEAKAAAVAGRVSHAAPFVVIGSDQVCHFEQQVYGKPGSHEAARAQLQAFSDRWVTFTTGLCLITDRGDRISGTEDFECRFRALTTEEIDRYIDLDAPLDCAGAIKAEAAGLLLMTTTLGRDINTLYGLPLMLLREYLAELGHNIFDFRITS